VKSPVTVLEAMLWEKVSVYDQIVNKILKRRRYGYQINFYTNLHLQSAYIICIIWLISHKHGLRTII